MSDEVFNPQLVLIAGPSGTGKSASLRNLKAPKGKQWWVCNTEAGKRLPFRPGPQFEVYNITDPMEVHGAFDTAREDSDCYGVIVDTTTFMMDMYETQYVINSANTMKAWGDYAQFFKILMQEKVAKLGKPAIFLAHVLDVLDEKSAEIKTAVPIKGSLKNNGIEAYFSTVVYTKKMRLKDLEKYKNKMLTISPEEEALGFKYVFQTRVTKATTGERIRSPMDMFTVEETYIDNDANTLLNHLNAYYGVTP